MFHFSLTSRAVASCFIAAALSAASWSATAGAKDDAIGLGQRWPHVQDRSLVPGIHVYVFEREGIRYIQLNDVTGTVLGAVAVGGGQFVTLPMGTQAERIATPDHVAVSGALGTTPAVKIFDDGSTQITANEGGSGQFLWTVTGKAGAFQQPSIRALDTQNTPALMCGECGTSKPL